MRILIAEDEKDLSGILASRLKSEHYSVDSCYDGEEACAYLDSAEYDAVILDIMMPKLDGLSVLKRMTNGNDGTPVLLLTAKDSIEDRVMGLVTRGGEEIRLSGKEFALLRYMVQNEGIVLSRDRLEQHLWNFDYAGGSNVIDVYIRYLRKKIDEGREPKLIHTVRGAGYVLKVKE